jgi:Protein of unknown function (DUF3723)
MPSHLGILKFNYSREMPSWQVGQLFAESQESDRQKSRVENFQGTARIRLDNLSFGREPDRNSVQILQKKFKKSGCLRLDPDNHIEAVIPESILQHAIQASRTSAAALKSPPDGYPPELIFPSDYAVQGLDGCARIEVAKKMLSGSNRWWTVDIYNESCVLRV